KKLSRSDYIEDEKKDIYIEEDVPDAIGYGQTISKPTLVLDMTVSFNPKNKNRILEIGTGSWYKIAMLATFCKEVFTVENIDTFHYRAKNRLIKKGFTNIYFKLGDGTEGWSEYQPYDRIIVTASVHHVPERLITQLAPGGRMI